MHWLSGSRLLAAGRRRSVWLSWHCKMAVCVWGLRGSKGLVSFWLKYRCIWSSSLRFLLQKKRGRRQKGHLLGLWASFMFLWHSIAWARNLLDLLTEGPISLQSTNSSFTDYNPTAKDISSFCLANVIPLLMSSKYSTSLQGTILIIVPVLTFPNSGLALIRTILKPFLAYFSPWGCKSWTHLSDWTTTTTILDPSSKWLLIASLPWPSKLV